MFASCCASAVVDIFDLTFDQGFFRRMEERRAKGAGLGRRTGRPNRVTGLKSRYTTAESDWGGASQYSTRLIRISRIAIAGIQTRNRPYPFSHSLFTNGEMIYTKDLVISTPYSSRVTTTSSHRSSPSFLSSHFLPAPPHSLIRY